MSGALARRFRVSIGIAMLLTASFPAAAAFAAGGAPGGQVAHVGVTAGTSQPGDWAGTYGADGYILGAWNGGSDLAALPVGVTYTVEQASRFTWASPTTDVRALESPNRAHRRAQTWHDGTQIRIRLNFSTPYAGTLHLYGVDWDALGRREDVTVASGGGSQTAMLTSSFVDGAWMHFPIAVPAGGSALITVDRTAGMNAVLSGLFLGDAGRSPDVAPAIADWIGRYGADGYVLGAWNGGSDLVALPAGVTYTVEQASRFTWASSTTDVRALESPSGAERRAATWHDGTQIRIRLNFSTPYAGTLHLYGVDWDALGRLENFTVDPGTGPQPPQVTTSFVNGAWGHFPITVPAGGSALITVDRTAGMNAVLSGLFLGHALIPRVPGAPSGLNATAGNGRVVLAWNAPASDGGSPISGYTATASPGGATCTTSSLGCTISGLTNGTTYTFSVAATNLAGDGPASPSATATPATVPGAPSGLNATAGNGRVVLAWNAPASDGGSPISGYTATASPGGATCTTSSLGCTISGLTNGTTYTFSVAATNAIGTGAASTPASARPVTVPGAPSGLNATAGNGRVVLAWNAPASDGGSPISGYTATASPGGATCTTSSLGCTISGLTNGTTYTFSVAATNVAGTGAASAPTNATPIAPATVPGPPMGLTATTSSASPAGRGPIGSGPVVLAWNTPSSNGGSPITGYRIYRGTVSGAETLLATVALVTGYTDTTAANGTTYYYQVAARNAMGEGARSAEASATGSTTVGIVPGTPRNFKARMKTDGHVRLSWSRPKSNRAGVTGYRIYRSTSSGTETFLVAVGKVTTYVDVTTTRGVRYFYRVSATNAAGEGPKSRERQAGSEGKDAAGHGQQDDSNHAGEDHESRDRP